MKNLFVCILFLLHLNVALIPHFDEIDIYDSHTGRQIDDVNTFIELVSVTLGIDTTADDEDDDSSDSGREFFSFVTICPKQNIVSELIAKNFNNSNTAHKFPALSTLKVKSISFDIESPPPEV
jgi:hypothetical protein